MFLLFLSFMLGLSLLLPWNSLLKSLTYIMTRVPVEWRETAPLWLTLTFILTNFLVLLGLTLSDADSRLIRQICGGEAVSTEKIVGGRLYGGLAGCAVLFVLACATPLIDLFDKSNDKGAGSLSHLLLFWGIFVSTGWTMCLLQRSVYPMMSLLPGKKESLVTAMLTGQAVSGIAASMGSCLFADSSGDNGADAGAGVALIYFGCSIAALLGTAGLFRYYEIKYASKDHQGEKQQSRAFSIGVLIDTARAVKPWPQLLSLNFAVTLSLFPGLLTSSARSLKSNDYFIPLTFLVFDAFDLLGKVMPSMFQSGLGTKSMLAMGFPVLRILFIPMFLMLPNFKGAPTLNSDSDWPYFITLALMAWTSGWGNAICLINGPQKVSEPTEEMGDRVGSLMGLSITVGLLLGSGSSLLLKTLLNQ